MHRFENLNFSLCSLPCNLADRRMCSAGFREWVFRLRKSSIGHVKLNLQLFSFVECICMWFSLYFVIRLKFSRLAAFYIIWLWSKTSSAFMLVVQIKKKPAKFSNMIIWLKWTCFIDIRITLKFDLNNFSSQFLFTLILSSSLLITRSIAKRTASDMTMR